MKICLIGSTRFIDRFNELNRLLTLQGHLVYSVATVSTAANGELPDEDKEILDLVHLRKIQESDVVVVIGALEDGSYYLGKSTRRELRWAMMNEKEVILEKAWTYSKEKVTSVEEAPSMILDFNDMIQQIMTGQVPDPKILEQRRRQKEFVESLSGVGQNAEERPN